MVANAAKRALAALAVAFSMSHPLAAVAAAGTPYKIMMVLWRGCEDACHGFQDYLRSQALRVEFLMRDVNQDASMFPNLVAEARARKVDLVVNSPRGRGARVGP